MSGALLALVLAPLAFAVGCVLAGVVLLAERLLSEALGG